MKIGLVGGGTIAQKKYIPALGDRIHTIVEPHPITNNDLKRKTNAILVRQFEEAPACDVWIVATPSMTHRDATFNIMKSNFEGPIIIEKPLELSYEKAETIYDTAKECNCVIHPVCQNRVQPSVETMKEYLRKETFGELLHVFSFLGWKRGQDYFDKLEAQGGGGVVKACLIHVFDLWTYLFGEFQISSFVFGPQHFFEGGQDTFTGLFMLPDQETTAVVFGSNAVGPVDLGVSLKVWGTKGCAELYGFSWENLKVDSVFINLQQDFTQGVAHKLFLERTLDLVKDGKPPIIKKREALYTLRLIDTILGEEK